MVPQLKSPAGNTHKELYFCVPIKIYKSKNVTEASQALKMKALHPSQIAMQCDTPGEQNSPYTY
jgi:hypothetical protein